jgi:hypothetical protein
MNECSGKGASNAFPNPSAIDREMDSSLAFVSCIVITCPPSLAGILLFLYSIVFRQPEPRTPA